jgi:hypothetical protein
VPGSAGRQLGRLRAVLPLGFSRQPLPVEPQQRPGLSYCEECKLITLWAFTLLHFKFGVGKDKEKGKRAKRSRPMKPVLMEKKLMHFVTNLM